MDLHTIVGIIGSLVLGIAVVYVGYTFKKMAEKSLKYKGEK